MTATDELRKMLDERGVEWRKPSPEYWVLLGMPEGDSSTIVGELSIEEAIDGTLVIWNATPAQAIEATLRRGECHDEGTFHSWGYFTCSNCKVVVPVEAVREAPSIGKVVPISFCPNCGRRVKVVDV